MPIELLITANSLGDMAYFPRLYTAIKSYRQQLGATLLIDTGAAWSSAAWLCVATENRAPYIILDAMGYTAAFADGLGVAQYEKVQSLLQMQLIPPTDTRSLPIQDSALTVRAGAVQVSIEDDILVLPLPPQYSLLHLTIALNPLRLVDSNVIGISPTTLPDPTIAGAVDFVADEARYYQKLQAQQAATEHSTDEPT